MNDCPTQLTDATSYNDTGSYDGSYDNQILESSEVISEVNQCPNFLSLNDTHCAEQGADFTITSQNMGMIRKRMFSIKPGLWCLVSIQNVIGDPTISGCIKIDGVIGDLVMFSQLESDAASFLSGLSLD